MIWTNPMDVALTAAWHASIPTPQIAAMIGLGVTASSVRGRARDLNLPQRGQFEAVWSGKYGNKAPPVVRTRPLPDMAILGPDSKTKAFSARAWGDCAFPVGDDADGVVICGAQVARGARRPYCPFHAVLTLESVHAA